LLDCAKPYYVNLNKEFDSGRGKGDKARIKEYFSQLCLTVI